MYKHYVVEHVEKKKLGMLLTGRTLRVLWYILLSAHPRVKVQIPARYLNKILDIIHIIIPITGPGGTTLLN